MTDDERKRASLVLRDLVQAFKLPPDWPVVITKTEGRVEISAGDLMARIHSRYGSG
jgi:hypothetical protein